MTDSVELRLEKCTVAFRIRERKGDYVHFDIEAVFHSLNASLPIVTGCSLSHADIKRLSAYADSSLHEPRGETPGPFAAYDAFFTLEFLADDAVRIMLQYAPQQPLSLGVEGSISEQSVSLFRDDWIQQIL